MSQTILFFCESIEFRLRDVKKRRAWLMRVIDAEEKISGDLNYIFCSDDYLHQMNVQYLAHDTLTDVITFDYCEYPIVSGDIYISITRVKENAKTFRHSFNEELNRVMVHGLLHLCGYQDKSRAESRAMRQKEDHYLELLRTA
ncbi:MAG: rRNA maturation RNase YbeY [Lentimicrobium sp.]|jgi:rRNA maturation RNase YbeY|nr:rRNA maturation RNase YbeY [Lentimicrobium sp.]MDD2529096.1 rRNA maturation RNase YbeY [Lentimicrobiaceae bacterium]MDD4598846.1 rRNA maturation RNase YbeY [Lentimicrobiaceae bacterium]MDY0025357.1 rRNA maturation RNase YbeY [Lentimicrobium sp.]